MKEVIIRKAICRICDFEKVLKTGEEPPKTCPACQDGSSKSYEYKEPLAERRSDG